MTEQILSIPCAAPFSATDCAACQHAASCASDIVGALTSGLIESLLDTPDEMLIQHIATARSQLVISMCQNVLRARIDTRAIMMRRKPSEK